MSNVVRAEFGRQQPTQSTKGERVADCDDGYTRLANELLDALIEADLTKHQYKVALAVIRKCYGFNKSFDRITNSQISELANIPETRVSTAKNQLLEMGILISSGRKIGPNKVLSKWSTNLPQNGESFPETGKESFPKTGKEPSPKQGNTKDTIQKTEKTKSKSICTEPAVAASVPMVIEGSLVGEGTKPEDAMQSTPVSSQSGLLPAQPLAANDQVAILLPLNTGEGYPVTCAFADQMRSLYPAVDVSQELRAMCGWLIGNPTKRKTKRGITRFITSWLSRCQDKGGSSGLSTQAYQQPAGTLDVNDTSWTKYLQEGF